VRPIRRCGVEHTRVAKNYFVVYYIIIYGPTYTRARARTHTHTHAHTHTHYIHTHIYIRIYENNSWNRMGLSSDRGRLQLFRFTDYTSFYRLNVLCVCACTTVDVYRSTYIIYIICVWFSRQRFVTIYIYMYKYAMYYFSSKSVSFILSLFHVWCIYIFPALRACTFFHLTRKSRTRHNIT
jgi:hypothetical protein